MPLGKEVGLGPSDIVLDGDPEGKLSTSRKKGLSPQLVFGPCLLWGNGWMEEDATWHGSRPWSMPHCVRRDQASPAKRAQ